MPGRVAARSDLERREQGELVHPKTLGGEDGFWHDLAVALGGRSIAEWQDAVSEEERSDWLTWIEKNGPISPLKRLDVLFAHHASIVLTAAGAKKQNGQPFTTADLLMKWVPDEEPEATPEAVMAMLRSKRKP